MNVPTITMPREQAEKAFQSFRRLVRERMRKEDEALRVAYKALAEGKALIDLVDVFRATGVDAQGRPRLAVCRADAE